MRRQELTQYDERGWRATFYTTGMEHSPTSATGTGWEPTPWHETQRAGWEALERKVGGSVEVLKVLLIAVLLAVVFALLVAILALSSTTPASGTPGSVRGPGVAG
jgi:hypothetical protein